MLNIDMHMYTIIFQTAWHFTSASRLNFHTTISEQILIQEMNLIFFRLIDYQPNKDRKLHQCIAYCCKSFSFFFLLIHVPRSTEKMRFFISFNFHFWIISTKKMIILILLITGLFPTFDVEIQHMTSQYCFLVDAKITSVF